jgi:phage tail protein X
MLGLYARWAGTTTKAILAHNPDLNPDRIGVGSAIVIPLPNSAARLDFEDAREAWHTDRTGVPPTAAEGAPGPDTRPPPDDQASEGPACARSYRLRHGDTVWVLARRWGVTVADVRRCNPSVNLDRVTAGRTLKVPDAAFMDD